MQRVNWMKMKDRLLQPVSCTICGRRRYRRSLLLRHVKTVHNVKDHVKAAKINKTMVEAALTSDQEGMDRDGRQKVEEESG